MTMETTKNVDAQHQHQQCEDSTEEEEIRITKS